MKNPDLFSGLCEKTVLASSRREFLQKSGLGFGMLGAGFLLARDSSAATLPAQASNPFAPKPTDFPAKAKHVVHIFAQGAPSHVDTWDPKPSLARYDGKEIPGSDGVAMASLALSLGAVGNVRTLTMRAFPEARSK